MSDKEAAVEWLRERDLYVRSDFTSDCDCSNWPCQHMCEVFYVGTLHDPSVGIFERPVTPFFDSQPELFKWIETHKDQIDREA